MSYHAALGRTEVSEYLFRSVVVAELQCVLRANGFVLAQDGRYGPQTDGALASMSRTYRRTKGLSESQVLFLPPAVASGAPQLDREMWTWMLRSRPACEGAQPLSSARSATDTSVESTLEAAARPASTFIGPHLDVPGEPDSSDRGAPGWLVPGLAVGGALVLLAGGYLIVRGARSRRAMATNRRRRRRR